MKATKKAMHEVSEGYCNYLCNGSGIYSALYVRSSWDILPTVFYNYDRNCAVWSCCIDTTPALCADVEELHGTPRKKTQFQIDGFNI
jgi:hypothetical protein